MNTIARILSLYMLLLSVLPCHDACAEVAGAACASEVLGLLSQPTQASVSCHATSSAPKSCCSNSDSGEEKTGHCSPTCSCACCHLLIAPFTAPQIFLEAPFKIGTVAHNSSCSPHPKSSFYGNVWHPPIMNL